MNCDCNKPKQPPCPAIPKPPFGNCDCSCTGNTTKYYNLPLWKANDVTSWLVGINYAMEQIDKVLWSFALRTGINGEPSDLVQAVSELTANQKQLLEWQVTALQDMANTTKIVSNILSNNSVSEEKIKLLNFNYSNLDVRVKAMEQNIAELQAQNQKVVEDVSLIMDSNAGTDELIATLQESIEGMQASITDLNTRITELEGSEVE